MLDGRHVPQADSRSCGGIRPRRYSRRDLARASGCTIKALRRYEAYGLIAPAYETGRKRYGEDAWARLHFVVALQRAGQSLAAISRVLKLRDTGDSPAHIAAHLWETFADLARWVDERLTMYQKLRHDLAMTREELLACSRCQRSPASCDACIANGAIGSLTRELLFDRTPPGPPR